MLLSGGHYFRNSMVAKYMFLVSATHYLSKRYVRASHPPMRIMGRFFCLAILNIPVERISQLLRTWQQLGMRGELMPADIEQFFICPWNKNGKQNGDHGWAKARALIGFQTAGRNVRNLIGLSNKAHKQMLPCLFSGLPLPVQFVVALLTNDYHWHAIVCICSSIGWWNKTQTSIRLIFQGLAKTALSTHYHRVLLYSWPAQPRQRPDVLMISLRECLEVRVRIYLHVVFSFYPLRLPLSPKVPVDLRWISEHLANSLQYCQTDTPERMWTW